MLKSVFLKNLKCFEEVSLPDLRDISILCGANNVGKSSIFQSLVFLKDSIRKGELDWSKVEPQLGDFTDMVHKHDLRRSITISCSFAISKEDEVLLKGLTKMPREISYTIRFNRDLRLVEESVDFDGGTPVIVIDHRSGRGSTFLYSDFTQSVGEDSALTEVSPNRFAPLAWGFRVTEMKDPRVAVVESLRNVLTRNFENMYFLSPRRGISDWSSRPSGAPAHVGYQGESTNPMLHYMFSERDKTFDKIEKWLRKFDSEIKMLKSPMRGDSTAIVVSTPLGDMNIMTSGYGLNAALPIVVQCLCSPPGSSILIEEPEIHLHSGAQKVLVDIFRSLLSDKKQVLFTTHSFDILLDFYERLRDKKIDENKVIRYDILKTRKGKRRVRKTDVHRYGFSGHGSWREQLRHLTERPP